MKNRITILGAGESGTGVALLAKSKGYHIFVSDAKAIKDNYKSVLTTEAIAFEENGHSDRIYDAELVIKSPGIPFNTEEVKRFIELKVPVIDEVEFAFRHTNAKVIAITGTNGKTTTTLLTHHLLDTAGIKAVVCGNVGKSFARAVLEHQPDYFVVEVSSFQLDGIDTFKPHIAILLNITPDHLDRYDYSMDRYAASKIRMAMNMDQDDHFIFFEDDPQIRKNIANVLPKVQAKTVSLHNDKANAFYDEQKLIFHLANDFEVSIDELALKGPHNYINCMCATVAAKLAGAKRKKVIEGLGSFINAPHRLEKAGLIKEVEFVNDSKATNVQSVKYALESFQVPLVLIAGGIDKGNDYSIISELVKRKVKVLICLGKDNEKLIKSFTGIVDQIFETTDINEAVKIGFENADPGEVVLLSPACASFDLFRNYEDRGEQFISAVKKLAENFGTI